MYRRNQVPGEVRAEECLDLLLARHVLMFNQIVETETWRRELIERLSAIGRKPRSGPAPRATSRDPTR